MSNAPFVMTVGLDIEGSFSDEEFVSFNDKYSQVHLEDLVECNPGFVRGTRYELVGQDSRGDFGPRFLALYEFNSKAAVDAYSARIAGPPEAIPVYRNFTNIEMVLKWRMIWRRLRPEVGELGAGGAPYLYLIGTTPGPIKTDSDVESFNEFTTDTHIPEVLQSCGFLRGSRFDLDVEVAHPAPGSPTFLTAYEGAEEALVRIFDIADAEFPKPIGGYTASTLPAWQQRDVAWRLIYRRVGSYVRNALL